jgi:pyridoxamine 5'-phosphate oxidase
LDRADLRDDPFAQFEAWFEQARQAQVMDVNAMALATVSAEGQPSVRVVLLKQFDARGFVWFTDYQSAKGQELAANAKASLMFYWPELDRQIRIWGETVKIPQAESQAYFDSRPIDSRISAMVSNQSQVIENRDMLLEKGAALRASLEKDGLPMPDRWGGYRLMPQAIEFWQGRPNRLHDRFMYRRGESDHWSIDRLSP